mgnify:CR=1 FL=1
MKHLYNVITTSENHKSPNLPCRENNMLMRTLSVSLVCSLLFSCASSNNTGSLYTAAEINGIKAKNWLIKNSKREGVTTTESGLQYKIVEQSTGCKPDPDYKVTVHYKMLSVKSRKIIDSSYERGNPDKFKLSKKFGLEIGSSA